MKTLLLSLVLTASAFGQTGQIPPDTDRAFAGGVHFMETVVNGAHDLTSAVSPSIKVFGWTLLVLFGGWALAQTLLQGSLRFFASHHIHPLAMVVAYISIMYRIVIATTMMSFYSVPIPGVSFSFSEMFPYLGQTLASAVTMDLLRQVLQHFADCVNYLPPVGMFEFMPAMITVAVLLLIGIGQVLMTVITAGSYAMLGILTACGPLIIPYYVLPGHEKKFWNWLDNMITVSSYSFVASCFVFIFCHSYLDFFFNLHGFSVGQWLVSIPYLLLITLVFAWAMFKVPALAHAIFGGLADIAQGFASGLQSLAVRAIIAGML